jgi:hypothetical protein
VLGEGLHVLRGDDPNLVPCRLELPLPVEGARASLDGDGARRKCFHLDHQSVPSYAALQDNPTIGVFAMQLKYVLRQIDSEECYFHDPSPVVEAISLCRGGRAVHPINWRKKYAGLMPSEMKRLRQLEEENAKLKRLVADLSLDKAMLQDVVSRKL